ncbi:hypothetical protein Q31b_42710 [Novipirellula aureliae]|uniref:Uncharacterized protein n=1 Tax=Novipirellula aureliae TaxID=2527966 RepID=A0A5C6DJC6_9BACT|nr:hypothetical protein [Novipirellula aureliae]TWU37483.1 hypothetical protein Q31b_42710 [Novipirellula aureliae]
MNRETVSLWLDRFEAIERQAIAKHDKRLVRLYESLEVYLTAAKLTEWYQRYIGGDESTEAVGVALLVDAYWCRDEAESDHRLLFAKRVWNQKRTRKRIVDAV